jgi:hypothetical protein
MSVMVIYRDNTDYARAVTEFLRDFKRRTARDLDEINPDSTRGIDLCKIYDIVEYPSIIATDEEGKMRNMWRGIPLPTIDEVSYYVQ